MRGHIAAPRLDVVGLGVSAVDVTALVDGFPATEGVRRAREIVVGGGGPVATAMVTLARLGARTAMIDAVGDDWRGGLILDAFRSAGVGVEAVRVRAGHTSATAIALVRAGDGARSITFAPGDAPELAPDEVDAELVGCARILHVNGRHWAACLPAVELARAAGVAVSFDGGADRYRPALRQLVPRTDVCIAALDFATRYTSLADAPRAAAALQASGPRLAVVTDGVRGSWVHARDGDHFHQPAFQVPGVVDTTGCGDSYHGAFLFGLVRGFDLRRTAALASAVAALNAGHLGGRGGLPTYDAAAAFLAARGAG